MSKKYTYIDLFAGCGGFSEGFYNEGFKPLSHVDIDKPCCNTLRHRLLSRGYSDEKVKRNVICGDLTQIVIQKSLEKAVNGEEVDVIVGGPPCQAFSSVGRAQDPFSMRNDPRNYLFKNYMEILERFNPKVFVFENVSGLLNAKPNGNYIFPQIIRDMSQNYSVCDDKETILLNSSNYGVPQVRKRVILIGVRKDLKINSKLIYKKITKTHFSPEMEKKNQTEGFQKYLTVKDAILDLPKIKPGEGKEVIEFKPKVTNTYTKLMRSHEDSKLYNHVARKHNKDDQERYKILSKNNWQLKDLFKVRPDLIHHDPKHFGNRYTVQSYNKPGRTIVAHLYKDGNLFIHPDSKQSRTFTVREAARIQSFPDDFQFVGSRTNQYKQVGNAVPPLMAQAIAKSIKSFL